MQRDRTPAEIVEFEMGRQFEVANSRYRTELDTYNQIVHSHFPEPVTALSERRLNRAKDARDLALTRVGAANTRASETLPYWQHGTARLVAAVRDLGYVLAETVRVVMLTFAPLGHSPDPTGHDQLSSVAALVRRRDARDCAPPPSLRPVLSVAPSHAPTLAGQVAA